MPVLELARNLVVGIGHQNVAGDAKDRFHTQVMSQEEMTELTRGWRTAWKGKVTTGISSTRQFRPRDTIVLLAISGGPECQWEYQELKTVILPQFEGVEVYHFAHLEEFIQYLAGGAFEN